MDHRQLFDDNVRHVRAALAELDRIRMGYTQRLQNVIAEPSRDSIQRAERALGSIESFIAMLDNIEATSKKELRQAMRAVRAYHGVAALDVSDMT